jgi:hypothetical protein
VKTWHEAQRRQTLYAIWDPLSEKALEYMAATTTTTRTTLTIKITNAVTAFVRVGKDRGRWNNARVGCKWLHVKLT